MNSSSILVIDALSLLFRAYYSIPTTLRLPDGTPVNAVFGFVNLLFQIRDTIKPKYLVVCFDVKAPTFRHELFTEYKGHRSPPPEDFVPQIALLKTALDDLGIVHIEKSGYEADDVMGTLSRIADEQQIPSFLMTGDQDALQLVSAHTTVILNRRGVSDVGMFTPQLVQETYQFSPAQMVDYKALKGDASDNIPGVKGIGDKTALSLLMSYGSLDGIYAHLDDIMPVRVRSLLESNRDMAFLSHELATICQHVPLEIDLETFVFNPDWDRIITCFKTFQFQGLIKKYQSRMVAPVVAPAMPIERGEAYRLLETLEEIQTYVVNLKNGFAFDLETTSLDILDAQIVGISFSVESGSGVYITLNSYVNAKAFDEGPMSLFGGELPAVSDVFALNPILKLLKPLFEDVSIPKVTHHGKYDAGVLVNYGIEVQGITFDTMLAAYLLFPGEKMGLKDLSRRLLNVEMSDYDDVVGKGKAAVSFLDVPLAEAMHYAIADADMTLQLKLFFEPLLHEKGLWQLFSTIEMPTQMVLMKMERLGIRMDTQYLGTLSRDFAKRSEVLKAQVYEITGHPFNLNSTKQLADVLFVEMKLPAIKKTKTGFSTDSSVLEKLREYPIAEAMLQYRTLEKLQSTYVNALPKMVHSRTGRVHSSFNQVVAMTGRLSSQNPNLQNIPIRTEEGSKIRRAFVPASSEFLLLSADYSQIELRVLAHLSNDPNMIRAFRAGEDIHSATASLVFDVPLSEVTKEHRYRAKTVNFGIVYGQSAFGLSETLGVSRAEAKDIIDAYYAKFPTIRTFMDQTISDARENGYVKTEFGRIRPLPEINDRNMGRRQFAERVAVNTRMQGTAADIIKLAMVRIQTEIETEKYRSSLLLQVHDELVLDVLKSEQDVVVPMVKRIMESVVEFQVPLLVDTAVGENWESVS